MGMRFHRGHPALRSIRPKRATTSLAASVDHTDARNAIREDGCKSRPARFPARPRSTYIRFPDQTTSNFASEPADLESLLPDVWIAAHPEYFLTHRREEAEAAAIARRRRRERRRAKAPEHSRSP
jgi:hypothetical protein